MTSMAPDVSPRLIPQIFTDDPVGLVAIIRTAFEATAEALSGRPTTLSWGESVPRSPDGVAACPDVDRLHGYAT